MSKLRMQISLSLDGFVAGPDQSVDNPLGVGGERLHEWAFPLKAWREPHGKEGGEVNESTPVFEELLASVGATIMGRNMFGGHPGPWNKEEPWNGWWGDEPPFHTQVFVLSHHAREPLSLSDTTFNFVTDGIETALKQARDAADGKVVVLAGGAQACREYLAAGLVDEMYLHVVPTLLGSGERLFDGAAGYLDGLSQVDVVAAPGVTHFKFART